MAVQINIHANLPITEATFSSCSAFQNIDLRLWKN